MSVVEVIAAGEQLDGTPGGPRKRGRGGSLLLRIRRAAPLLLPALVVLLTVLAAIMPWLFTSGDPLTGVPEDALQAPSWAHWFGTDQIGRDLFTRVVYGAAASVSSALIAVAVAAVVGCLVGLAAGYLRGVVDAIAMRLVDVILAIPPMLLALAVVSTLGFGTVNVAIAVGIVSSAAFARLMRSEVLKVRGAVFVEAARSAGVRSVRILGLHVLPNSWGPVAVLSALEFGQALLAVSALSFLGFGTPPPAPEWGSLAATGRSYMGTAWWLITFPGLVIALVVLCVNRLSRAAERNVID